MSEKQWMPLTLRKGYKTFCHSLSSVFFFYFCLFFQNGTNTKNKHKLLIYLWPIKWLKWTGQNKRCARWRDRRTSIKCCKPGSAFLLPHSVQDLIATFGGTEKLSAKFSSLQWFSAHPRLGPHVPIPRSNYEFNERLFYMIPAEPKSMVSSSTKKKESCWSRRRQRDRKCYL